LSTRTILGAASTNQLKRTTVNSQYDRTSVLMQPTCGDMLPLVFDVYDECQGHRRIIPVGGEVHHAKPMYEMLGLAQECCKRTLLMNFNHWETLYKSFVNRRGLTDVASTERHIQACNQVLRDSCGHTLTLESVREWMRDKYIYIAPTTLSGSVDNTMPNYQEVLCQ